MTAKNFSNTKTVGCCTFSIGVFLGADSFWLFSGLTAADTAEGLTSDTKKEENCYYTDPQIKINTQLSIKSSQQKKNWWPVEKLLKTKSKIEFS